MQGGFKHFMENVYYGNSDVWVSKNTCAPPNKLTFYFYFSTNFQKHPPPPEEALSTSQAGCQELHIHSVVIPSKVPHFFRETRKELAQASYSTPATHAGKAGHHHGLLSRESREHC